MKKNAVKKDSAKKAECADGGNGNGGIPSGLMTEFAAQIAQAVAMPAPEAEALGRQAAANLPKAEPVIGNIVECIGQDCGESGELSSRTLVVRDADTIQPVCPRCAEAARRANLALLPYGIWQERRDKFAAKVEELRTLDIKATGGDRKLVHEAMLDLSEEELDKAVVVSLANVPTHEVRGAILANKLCLSAFFKTHLSRNYYVDEAKCLLEDFEREERQAKKQEDYFRRIAETKRQKFVARGERRQQAGAVRIAQFASMAAGGGNGGGNGNNGGGDKAPALRRFGIEIPPGIKLGDNKPLTTSPFAGLTLESPKQ